MKNEIYLYGEDMMKFLIVLIMFRKFLFFVNCRGMCLWVLGFNKVLGLIFSSIRVVFVWFSVYV